MSSSTGKPATPHTRGGSRTSRYRVAPAVPTLMSPLWLIMASIALATTVIAPGWDKYDFADRSLSVLTTLGTAGAALATTLWLLAFSIATLILVCKFDRKYRRLVLNFTGLSMTARAHALVASRRQILLLNIASYTVSITTLAACWSVIGILSVNMLINPLVRIASSERDLFASMHAMLQGFHGSYIFAAVWVLGSVALTVCVADALSVLMRPSPLHQPSILSGPTAC